MRLTVIFCLFLSFAATSCEARPFPRGVTIDSIAVYKREHRMYVFSEGRLIKTYRIALGTNPRGRKVCQGDCKTPEGLYYIEDKNPESDYYKNLGISYPNDRDRARARNLGRSPGGDIKIHGLPNGKGYLGRSHTITDWTEGCIAVTNAEIDELYANVEVGTPIRILP
jgi:murein L,D-transpeptidase YafK